MCSIPDCIINASIKESVVQLIAQCWMTFGRNFDLEAVNDFQGFVTQQDEVRSIFVLAHKVDIQEVYNSNAAHITEDGPE